MHDKARSGNRTIGQRGLADIEEVEEGGLERILADGSERELDYYGNNVTYFLNDMSSGVDVSVNSKKKFSENLKSFKNKYFDEPDMIELFKKFEDQFSDYVDSDDLIGINGAEEAYYKSAGMAPLPRNGRMQFRQEMAYLPSIGDFEEFKVDSWGRLASFRIIVDDTSFNKKLPGFFASENQYIADVCNLSEDELLAVVNAKEQWYSDEQLPLFETLDGALLARIKSKFRLEESGYYTFIIKGGVGEESVSRTLTASLRVRTKMPTRGNSYYEWILY